jgi:LysR family transcriptional activator of nhaA
VDWLNYHHLRYFWVAAREGSLRRAAEKLHVSQPSISAQIKELEQTLGQPLFRKNGRQNVLTEAGQVALRYADEIFGLGSELLRAIQQQPGEHALRFYVGVADSFPKLLTNEVIRPVLNMSQRMHVICREGKQEDLLAQLAAHRLDLVLSDEPASTSQNLRTFSHMLGESPIVFCATPELAKTLRKGYPRSLHQAPALLPAENTALRRSLEQWFQTLSITPKVVAEFDDAALMKVMAADGKGFIPIPEVVCNEALQRYGFKVIGKSKECRERFYLITAERRISHPAVVKITEDAQRLLRI